MNAKVKFEFYPQGNREKLEDFKQGQNWDQVCLSESSCESVENRFEGVANVGRGMTKTVCSV